MAELLVKAQDAPNFSALVLSDSAKAYAGCYLRGDIVEVRPDGANYGKEEGLPKFVVIKIPDLTITQAQKYVAPHLSADKQTVLRRRLYSGLLDSVPAAVKLELKATGVVTVTFSQIRNYIKNKKTGLVE